jgi:putative flavoprotein involved in K+ transport
MRRTDILVIGAGQAGLAMSFCLARAGIDHVVLERGRIGERWRSERWDSLRLLTPNWMTRLPGHAYAGPEPDGFMTVAGFARLLEGYAQGFAAPVSGDTTVRRVEPCGDGFRVSTDRGIWWAAGVVIATGACDRPLVPAMAGRLAPGIQRLAPSDYRNPDALPEGGVLVVGASASGAQIALELASAGRRVILAVGGHTRLPRSHRGRDIMWWLDRAGILDERAKSVADLAAARTRPSLQLVGRPSPRLFDLGHLTEAGVRLVGRLAGIEGSRVRFAGDLARSTADAERRLRRLLARLDCYAAARGPCGALGPPDPPPPLAMSAPAQVVDLAREGVTSVVFATGFVRRYPWLAVDVLDDAGEIRNQGGITPWPGLFVLGLPFLRRRKSTYIDGVGDDAREIAIHIRHWLAPRSRRAA